MQEKTINPTHSFDIADAERLGSIEKALILKEIRQMAAYKMRTKSSCWVYYSAPALAAKFPYMANKSIQRWLKELVNDGELISRVKNKFNYDKTKSYTLPHFEKAWSKMSHLTAQNGTTIPSLSTPLSVNAEQSSENITTNSETYSHFTEKSNHGGETDFVVERVHEESGEPISPRKKPNSWEREKSVFAAFSERCKAEVGTEPEPAKIWQLKQIRSVLERYTEDQLGDVFDEWFATAGDEAILNIHVALSANNLNRLKLKL